MHDNHFIMFVVNYVAVVFVANAGASCGIMHKTSGAYASHSRLRAFTYMREVYMLQHSVPLGSSSWVSTMHV